MTTVEEINQNIDESFDEFVEQPSKLTKKLLNLADENDFNQRKISLAFRKYLKSVAGDDEEMIGNIMEKTDEVLTEYIIPNQDVLHPSEKETKPAPKPKALSQRIKIETKKVESKSSGDEKSEEDDKSSSKRKSKKAASVKEPKRRRGYDLYYNVHKEDVAAQMESEWKKKYKNAPYTKNPAAISKEIGNRWKEETPEVRQEYNEKADKENETNGLAPRGRKGRVDADKRPRTAYNMYHSEKYEEMRQKYIEENDLEEDAKVSPVNVMKMTSKTWNSEIKTDKDKVQHYQDLADKFNEEHHRVFHPKEKEKSNVKTTAYRVFCAEFRKNEREPFMNEKGELSKDYNTYDEAARMNAAWSKIKDNEGQHESWQEKAKEANLEMGFAVET